MTDMTATYLERFRDRTRRGNLAARFGGKKFILVRGFVTDALEALDAMMEDQETAVREIGGHPLKPVFDSGKPPSINAPVIAQAIRDAGGGGPVFLITHSKGSVDTLAALVENRDIRAHVAGWVSLQGAIGGSVVADKLVGGNPVLREALGRIAAFESLQTGERAGYLRTHEDAITEIVQAIPIVAYGSSAEISRSALRLVTSQVFAAAGEHRNDGLVAIDCTRIPGAMFTVSEDSGPDHADAVVNIPPEIRRRIPMMHALVPGQGWDRIAMTHALLSLLP
jgi:hypothetical protein